MNFRTIARLLFAEPFRPFRIKLREGRSIMIDHPDMLHIGVKRMTVNLFFSDDEQSPNGEVLDIILADVESVEPLPSAAGNQRT